MTDYKIRLIIITLILFVAGCSKKDELTLPVRIHFKIGISQDNSLNIEYLSFTGCQIGIQSIRFEGKREAGGDIFFDTDSKMNLQTLTFTKPVIISHFDIPQGIYNYMKWDISMKCIDTGGLIDERNESYPCIGIVFSGNYTSLNGSVIPFIFAIDEPEELGVIASAPDDKPRIVLSVKKEYEAAMLFDPVDAFSTISRESFEEAEISGDGGNQKIIISNIKNKTLYEILSYRIFHYAEVIVKSAEETIK